jgi:hypothetical protein
VSLRIADLHGVLGAQYLRPVPRGEPFEGDLLAWDERRFYLAAASGIETRHVPGLLRLAGEQLAKCDAWLLSRRRR